MRGGIGGAGAVEIPEAEGASGGGEAVEAIEAIEAVEDGEDVAAVEADARTSRIERVVVLYAQITAAKREFLAAVAECDRHRDWAAAGFGSCAEWLTWRLGIGRNAANERVRVARALEDLPQTSEAMGRGKLSFSKIRALTRVASAGNEAELLELARSASAAHLERMVRAYRTMSRDDEARRERLLHRTRRFSVVPDGEGMYVVRGRLMPEVAAVLMRAVDAAADALYAASTDEEREEIEPPQRRADAVGLLAERALATGFGDEDPVSGTRADRFQVMLHVEPETLAQSGEPGMSELEDGTRVSAETARRLACDASRVDVAVGAAGPESEQSDEDRPPGDAGVGGRGASELERSRAPEMRRRRVLDVGRRTRTVPTSLRRALEARDRGCRFPGCGGRFTDAHHIVHWADGGETKLSNLVLLCRRHHRRVHEEGWEVCSDAESTRVVFFMPQGRALAEAPPLRPPRKTCPRPFALGAGAAAPMSGSAYSSTTASASISIIMSGWMRRRTSTMVVVGGWSPKISRWARPYSSHSSMSVTNIRVRVTCSGPAPSSASASRRMARQRAAWA
ncbi:MAG: DUF222 domain-containing protein [Longimicrobiales bacterium]|nr:DUF222 domain-containing protein [Longimicrobiales bacterium]